MKFSIRALLLSTVAFAVLFATVVAARQRWLAGETELSRLTLPDKSQLRITVDNDDAWPRIFWQRFVDSKPQQGQQLIGVCSGGNIFDADFGFDATDNGDVVVVFERRNPDVVLLLLEFSTGAQYHCDARPDPYLRYFLNSNQVLQKLRDQERSIDYILSDAVRWDRPLFVK